MDLESSLEAMASTLADADAELVTDLGGHREVAQARLWQGKVLVDWEPDEQAGGCLLRPALVRRLLALHADATLHSGGLELRLRASGRVVTALSETHAQLVTQLGGAARVELRARLRFAGATYEGGDEVYSVVERGRRFDVLRLTASVRRHPARSGSPRTSRAPT
jgi:hypothetical protein